MSVSLPFTFSILFSPKRLRSPRPLYLFSFWPTSFCRSHLFLDINVDREGIVSLSPFLHSSVFTKKRDRGSPDLLSLLFFYKSFLFFCVVWVRLVFICDIDITSTGAPSALSLSGAIHSKKRASPCSTSMRSGWPQTVWLFLSFSACSSFPMFPGRAPAHILYSHVEASIALGKALFVGTFLFFFSHCLCPRH